MNSAIILKEEEYNSLLQEIKAVKEQNLQIGLRQTEFNRKNTVLYNSEISVFLGYGKDWIYKAANKAKLVLNNRVLWHNHPNLGIVAYVDDLKQYINQGRSNN
jgi:hypothetical protein